LAVGAELHRMCCSKNVRKESLNGTVMSGGDKEGFLNFESRIESWLFYVVGRVESNIDK
jgi:hypothetical protein